MSEQDYVLTVLLKIMKNYQKSYNITIMTIHKSNDYKITGSKLLFS